MKNMIGVVRILKGRISEPMRSSVAHALAKAAQESMNAPTASWWHRVGREQFSMACDITVDPQTIPDDFKVTDLAKFINRWRAVTKYKDGDWKDLTGEMRALIVTMTEELEEMA